MNNGFPRRLALATAVLVSLAARPGCERPEPVEPPNILLISVDTLRADHLGVYGYDRPTSPSIDTRISPGVTRTLVTCSTRSDWPASEPTRRFRIFHRK